MAAAVHSLPVELISRIFVLGCQDELDPDALPSGTHHFEVLVSHVCQHWRTIALHTATLWTTIHFRTLVHHERAMQYLSRSNRNLIDIVVDTTSQKDHVPGRTLFRDEFKPTFGLVTPHIDRWRSLALKVRDLTCKRFAREVLSTCGSAGRLESLQLWHIEEWGTAERLFTAIGPPPVVVFEGSLPSLKNISLIGVNLPWTHSKFLEGLQTIDFALHSDDVRIPYELWRRMLSRSPNLEKLSLCYSGPKFGDMEDWDDERITLPKLHDVQLTDLDPAYLMTLFNRLVMPNVRSLKVELHDQDFTSFVDYLVKPPLPEPFQQQYQPHPDTLPINGMNGGSRLIVNGDENPLGGGSGEAPRGPVFPNLNTLTVVALECSTESWKSLLRTSCEIECLEVDFSAVGDGCFETLFWVEEQPQRGRGGGGEMDVDVGLKGKGKGKSVSMRPACSSLHLTPHHYQNHNSNGNGHYQAQANGRQVKILLPNLHTIRISGDVSPGEVRDFIRFRRAHNRPLKKWVLDEKYRDGEMDAFVQAYGLDVDLTKRGWEEKERIEWYKSDDDDDEGEVDDDEGSDVYGEEEDVIDEDVEEHEETEEAVESD